MHKQYAHMKKKEGRRREEKGVMREGGRERGEGKGKERGNERREKRKVNSFQKKCVVMDR